MIIVPCCLVDGSKQLSVFFFVKQKTAYDMRISDWSSDVCSSDLLDYSRQGYGACLHIGNNVLAAIGTAPPCTDEQARYQGEIEQNGRGGSCRKARHAIQNACQQRNEADEEEDRKSVV